MSTLKRAVPTVTYTLFSEFDRKKSNRKLRKKYRFLDEDRAIKLQKTRRENDKRLAKKAELRERKVIPFSFFKERRDERIEREKKYKADLEKTTKDRELKKTNMEEQKDWEDRMKRFRKELLHSGVPYEAKELPVIFQICEIGKAELFGCEKLHVSALMKLAKIVGFDVRTEENGKMTALVLCRPYP